MITGSRGSSRELRNTVFVSCVVRAGQALKTAGWMCGNMEYGGQGGGRGMTPRSVIPSLDRLLHRHSLLRVHVVGPCFPSSRFTCMFIFVVSSPQRSSNTVSHVVMEQYTMRRRRIDLLIPCARRAF